MLEDFFEEDKIEAGCDEAGRGCLAGPVFAAAVILPYGFHDKRLNDSKKLNENTRYLLRTIIEKEALSWAVAFVDHKKIDSINILNASIEAMHLAIAKLTIKPENLLIDGNRFKKYDDIKHYCIIKGDGKFKSIAAASVLAKTYRDDFMLDLHRSYPQYGWNSNKAYATETHRLAIGKYGYSPYHRISFKLKPKQTKLPFSY